MDEWLCVLTYAGRPMEPEEFAYFTGLGHRSEPAPHAGAPYTPRTLAWEAWQRTRKPVRPTAADVLHALVGDAEASSMTFDEWCDAFGYDNDSRKAFAVYEACQDTAEDLYRVADCGVVNALREALADY